jgi:hypothetical protein
MKWMVGVVALSLAPMAGTNAAQLVTNGDFEAAVNSPPPGWSVAPGNEIGVSVGQNYVNCCGASGSLAARQNQFANFGSGDRANVSTLSQVLATVGGEMYQFSFDWGAFAGSQTLTARAIDVATSNVLFFYSVTDTTPQTDLDRLFSNVSASFQATGTTRIEFTAVGSPTISRDLFLDNVSVLGVAAVVPEPSTWAFLIVGFGLIGGALRRRSTTSPVRYSV